MRRQFQIMDGVKFLESHDTLEAASKAFWVVTAHEVKNGRSAERYTLHGGTLIHFEKLNLAPWAVSALTGGK